MDGDRVETLLHRPAFAFAVFAIATATTFFTFAPDLVVTAQRGAIALSALLHRAKRKCQPTGNLAYIFFENLLSKAGLSLQRLPFYKKNS